MPTAVVGSRSLLLIPLLLASACEVSGGPGLTTMYSCADGAAVTDPHANNWRMRVGEVRIAYAHDEVDMVIDEQVGIQMVYKARGKSLYGDHDDNYEGKTSYREVWADRGTQEFYHQYDEVAGNLYSLEALSSSADGRFEIWSDGWIWDNHLFSCYIRSTDGASAIPSPGISSTAIVEARNASHGSTPVPVVLTADDFHCTSASTHQPAEAPVITRLELFFTSEPAFSQVKIAPESSTPTSESSCRVDSAYAYDWDIWVQSFEVSRDSLPAGMDPGVQLRASVTPNGQPEQEYLTFGVISDLRWERGERISFEQPLQFENIACAGNGVAPCGSQLRFDFIAPGGSATFASGCKLTVPLDRIIDSGNRSLDIQHGTNITPEDRYIVTVAPGDGLECDDDRGLYVTEGATRTALPMQIAFMPRLKPLATAAVLDLPGADTGGGGGSAEPADGDGDAIPDAADNCPGLTNANQANADGDAMGDACDDDDDGDGVLDADDNCATAANPDQANADGDATGDACDSDDDGDGVLDGLDNCPLESNPGQENADQDGLGDACDTPTDPADIDEDGRADEADNCPSTPNGDQANADGDAMGNACDPDDDEDKVADADDNCPLDFNPDQENADGDPMGDACDDDDDGDTVLDSADNCPLDANTDQADTDGDRVGDACDGPGGNDNDGDGGDSGGGATDSDGDGIPDDGDNCVFDRNVDQYDSDDDGIGDVCDQAGGGGGSTPDTMNDDHSGMSAGCSAGGGAPASGAMLVLLLLAALVLRRRTDR
jgi:uncharacterized protein (TIGR03382 family)